MAYTNTKQPVIASLLDRLLDDDPRKQHENPKSRHQMLNELHASVRRDLENLLNTRVSHLQWPPEWKELTNSSIAYGIPDFMNMPLTDRQAQREFCAKLSALILRFEPRFKTVEVNLLTDAKQQDRTLRLRIEGMLYAEPVLEPIMLDSVLEPETQNFSLISAD
jgi:type VI secretion system protein ImpF